MATVRWLSFSLGAVVLLVTLGVVLASLVAKVNQFSADAVTLRSSVLQVSGDQLGLWNDQDKTDPVTSLQFKKLQIQPPLRSIGPDMSLATVFVENKTTGDLYLTQPCANVESPPGTVIGTMDAVVHNLAGDLMGNTCDVPATVIVVSGDLVRTELRIELVPGLVSGDYPFQTTFEAVSHVPIVPPSGMVGWWPGDGNADDLVNGNPGTLSGDAIFVPGMVGQAFSLDGTGDFVAVPDNNGDLNITVDLWARRIVFDESVHEMSSKSGVGELGGGDAYDMWFRPSNVVVAGALNATGSYDTIVGPVVEDSDFHHYAYVRRNDRHMLFMDGEVVASGDLTADVADTSGVPMTIGAFRGFDNTSFSAYFGGVIDEVAVFNRALTAEEVWAIYEAGSVGKIKPELGQLHGDKWNDLDGDGVWDAGELGLPDWEIVLDLNRDGTGDRTTITDPLGAFSFIDVPPGTFDIWETPQFGWVQTYPDQPKHSGGVSAGQVIEGLGFGNMRDASVYGELHGTKFHDLDTDGLWDPEEPRLPDFTIVLDIGDDGTGDRFTQTNSIGDYWFIDVPIGPFRVSESPPPGWVHTHPISGFHTGDLSSREVVTGLDFGNREHAAADFTISVTSGDAPLIVQFTDASTGGTPVSWLWNFGDGFISTGENPTHTYNKGGLFTVNLTVTVPGGSSTQTKYGIINVTGLVSKLVFYSDQEGNHEIYTMDENGSNQSRLTNNSAIDWGPAWSPDGTKIAFYSTRDGNYEIYVMTSTGSGQTRLTTSPQQDEAPTWSPDSSKITFSSDRDGNLEIYTMDSDGANQTNVTRNDQAADEAPAWSPDGTQITFHSWRGGLPDIYRMNSDGTAQTQITTDPGVERFPDWSPDGARIAFDSNQEIWIMNSDGTNQTPLGGGEYPAWSPDGNKIAFSGITVMDADGTDPVNPAPGMFPSWSPAVFPKVPLGLLKTTPDSDTTPEFIWQASPSTVSYEVSLNGASWIDIGNVTFFTVSDPLVEGSHTLGVRAIATTGFTGSASSLGFDVHITPPS